MKSDIIIGLEIHVELDTKTKLFCSCPTFGSEVPNTRVCEICLGMPGSKPKVNKKAIEFALKLAKALSCKINKEIVFSRKSYFYPDMAKNYQITQYEIPLAEKGYLFINNKKIRIKRVHLEEDPASLVHPFGINKSPYVLVDYNRSGNPLVEIVTEPEISSAEEARTFMKTLITILRYLKIFDINKNIIKADANVSIKESGYTRTEIKNITGFKEIEKALNYEILRHKQLVSEGKKLSQETRAWNSELGITEALRTKETEEDYGYIFDPDLVKIETSLFDIKLPEMPMEKAKRYVKQYNLAKDDAYVLTQEYELTELFEKAIKKVNPILAARWIRRELMRVLNYNKIDVSDMPISKEQFIKLLALLEKGKITDTTAKKILEELVVNDFDVEYYIKKHNLEVLKDSSVVEKICEEAINENPKAVQDYKKGKQEALNFLLGQVMRKTKGKVDAREVKEILKKLI